MWWMAAALAGGADLKVLVMPLTPADEYQPEFHALVPFEGAGDHEWGPSHPGFQCVADGDYVEIWARRESWPSVVPKAVECKNEEGRIARAKVRIIDRNLEPMFVADGTLVMPREKKNSAIFHGAPPRLDFGVQQGRTGSLSVLCKIKPGPELEVVAYPNMEDGEGRCTLQTTLGEKVQFPIRVRTIKRSL